MRHNDAVTAEALADQDQQLRDWIVQEAQQRGNAIIEVAPSEDEPGYSFTACAWALHEVPEAIVVGLPEHFARVLLDAYVDRAAAGEQFYCGRLYDDFFDGVAITFEQVAPGHYPEFLGSAFLIYPQGDFPVLQIIVPTPEGQWPWSDDAPEGFAEWQPILTESGVPESWKPGVNGP